MTSRPAFRPGAVPRSGPARGPFLRRFGILSLSAGRTPDDTMETDAR
jgi:hypothetical protein